MMKARVRTGYSVKNYYGGFGARDVDQVSLSCFDADQTIGICLGADDKLKPDTKVAIQFAILFTDVMGVRKIRVINYQLPVAANISNYYKCGDQETIAHFILMESAALMQTLGSKVVRERIINNLV